MLSRICRSSSVRLLSKSPFGIPSGFYKRLAAYLERKSNGLLQSLTLPILTQLLLWLLHVKS